MWFLQKLRGKMESLEAKSQLDNQQQLPDLRLQSDPSIDKDKLVQVIAQDLENLVLSCKDEVIDRNLQGQSVAIDEVKQAVDEDLRHLVAKEDVNEAFQSESSSGSEEKNNRDEMQFVDEVVERHCLEKVVEVDPEEFRVSEERETGESEIGCDNQEEEVDEGDLKKKHEIEIEDEDMSNEIGDCENNGEQRRDADGNDRENESKNVGKSKGYHYPVRLDAGDCSFYIRTGVCRFGSNCRFNHPLKRKNQPTKETKKQKEENVERHGQTECKYNTSSAGCKYGKACKYNHGRGKTVKTPVVEYNFLGLPIRPGEKECPYYMRNGSCKYGPSCRFNHPDPTAAGGDDAATTYGNNGPLPSQRAPQPNIPNRPSRSTPRTPDPTAAFVPMMYPPTQNMPPPNQDWNGYQAPSPVPAHLYPSSEQGLPIPPAFFLNNPPNNVNMYTHQQQPVVSEYPERPGQPDCSYFMKTGVCKYRASCRFHHPQSRISRTLREKGMKGQTGL